MAEWRPEQEAKLHAHLMEKPGAAKDYKAEWGWDRYLVGGKMFAARCCPGESHKAEYAGHPLLSLKCDSALSEMLRGQHEDIRAGFYMDKASWISIRLDGEVPEDLIYQLCDASYGLVFGKLTKKAQREILEKG